MGSMLPKMGSVKRKRNSGVANALFGQTRQRVLALFFGMGGRELAQSDAIAQANSGSGAVQREIEGLERAGLLVSRVVGRTKLYRANADAAIHDELAGLIDKTLGVPMLLRAALAPLADRIVRAVLFGSSARGDDRASSDIDVILVGDELQLEEVYAALERVEKRIGRVVSPTVYTEEEYERRRRERHPFLEKVLGGKHVVLFGTLQREAKVDRAGHEDGDSCLVRQGDAEAGLGPRRDRG